MSVCFGCTISVHHQILAVMGPSTTGSVDDSFRWKSIFTPDPGPMDCHNSFYNSSPVTVAPRWIPKSAHAVLYSGSATVMGNTSQIEPHQRPALSTFHNHDHTKNTSWTNIPMPFPTIQESYKTVTGHHIWMFITTKYLMAFLILKGVYLWKKRASYRRYRKSILFVLFLTVLLAKAVQSVLPTTVTSTSLPLISSEKLSTEDLWHLTLVNK